MSGFADAHKQAIASGFPDTVDTYGLISGLWTSVFALGAFIGPTVAGILFDAVGFPWGSMFVVITQLLAMLLILGFTVFSYFKSDSTGVSEEENRSLLDSEANAAAGASTSYGGTDDSNDRDPDQQPERRRRTGARVRRQRKYSEVVSSSVAGSMGQSLSMAYPKFLMASGSYANPPPSMAGGAGAVGGSLAAYNVVDTDSLLHVPENQAVD